MSCKYVYVHCMCTGMISECMFICGEMCDAMFIYVCWKTNDVHVSPCSLETEGFGRMHFGPGKSNNFLI